MVAGPPITDVLAADAPADFTGRIACEGGIGASDPVAIVRLRSADGREPGAVVLRDYADVSQPRTVCTFTDVQIHSLIDARHVVVGGGSPFAVVDLPEVTYRWFELPDADTWLLSLLAVAPTLDSVIYRRAATDGSLVRQIVMTSATGEHVLADLPPIDGGRCGSPLDSAEGAFPRTGQSFYVLDQPIATKNVLLAGRGTHTELELYPPDEGWADASTPLMAVWSPVGETLYYRIGADVMRWSPGSSPELFLPATPWLNPTFTPDGRHLAYATDAGVYLVDMRREPAPQLIRAGARTPVFVNPEQLWFQVSASTGCITDETEDRIYDVNDRSEGASIIDGVLAVWPATSSSSR